MSDNKPDQPTKFRTKNWVEINDESRGTYNENNHIRFKTSMLRSCLCDYSDAYILVKGTITVTNAAAHSQANNGANKKEILKNCAPFTSWISRINNTQANDAQYIDVVLPMHNLIEYSDNYLKTSGILWQFYRDVPAVDDDGVYDNGVDDNGVGDNDNEANNCVSFTENNDTAR